MASFSLTNAEIVRAVLQLTGLGRDPSVALADAAVEADVRAIVRSGMRRFFFPIQASGAAYQWRFLEENFSVSAEAIFDDGTIEVSSGTVTLTGGTFPADITDHYIDVDGHVLFVTSRDGDTQVTVSHTQVTVASGSTYTAPRYRYDLPSDFSQFVGGVVYQNENKKWMLINSDEPSLRLRYAIGYEPAISETQYFAVKDGQIYFWPILEPESFIQGVYQQLPDDNLPGDLDTPGATAQVTGIYAEAMLEAILAAAEAYNDDTAGIHEQRFQVALQNAINQDGITKGYFDFSGHPNISHAKGYGLPTALDFSDQIS